MKLKCDVCGLKCLNLQYDQYHKKDECCICYAVNELPDWCNYCVDSSYHPINYTQMNYD